MTDICQIIEDSRPISALHFERATSIFTGSQGVTDIKPFLETTTSEHYLWFAIIAGGEIVGRVSAHIVGHIEYETESVGQ